MKKITSYLTAQNIAIVAVVLILGMMLPGKFSGAPDTVALFTKIGQEPFARFATAILELLGIVGLLIPATRKYAAIGIILLMIGALYFHATILGRGMPAPLAIVVIIACVIIIQKDNCQSCHSAGVCEK